LHKEKGDQKGLEKLRVFTRYYEPKQNASIEQQETNVDRRAENPKWYFV
jgi:hypothetical protein